MHFDSIQHWLDGMSKYSVVFLLLFRVMNSKITQEIAREHSIQTVEKSIKSNLYMSVIKVQYSFIGMYYCGIIIFIIYKIGKKYMIVI